MSVRNRIKIIKFREIDEVETKINEFFEYDYIIKVISINYYLSYNFVIIEYETHQ